MDGGRNDAATVTMQPAAAPATARTDAARGETAQSETTHATTAETGPAETSPTEAAPGRQARPTAPPLPGRVSYVFGGTMPAPYRDWVLRDLTAPGWRWRQALRPVLMMLPVAIIFALLPGPVGTRGTLVGFLLVAPFALGLAMSGSFRNRRLTAHKLPVVSPTRPRPAGTKTPGGPAGTATAGTPAASTLETPAPTTPAAPTPSEEPDDPDGINA